MTLILGCLTEHCVYQVSDRRLMFPNRKIADERSNKSVLLDGRVAFGYTGISRVAGIRTDEWLARTLAEVGRSDMNAVCTHLRDAATEVFQREPYAPADKRHAFHAVGWFRLRGETDLTPGVVTVANALDGSSGDWLAAARPMFEVRPHFPTLRSGGFVLNSAGFRPTPEERSAVFRLVRSTVRHRRSTPQTVAYALILAVKWLASRHDEIGSDLLLLSIPRKAVEAHERSGTHVLLLGPPSDVTATFLNAQPAGRLEHLGPHFVSRGSLALDFKAGSIRRDAV